VSSKSSLELALSSSRSFLLLVVAGICWGTGGVVGRVLSEAGHVSAPAVAAYRLLLGGALLVVYVVAAHRVPRRRRAWRRIGAVAGLAAAFQACYFAAVAIDSVSVATLIAIGSAPMLVVVWEAVSTRHLPAWASVRPVVLGIAGLALLVGAPASRSLGAVLAGAGLSVLAGAGFALLTLLGRRPVPQLDETATVGFGFLAGGSTLAVVLLAWSPSAMAVRVSPLAIGMLAVLATVPTALAYLLYFRGLRGSSAVTATVVALLEPLTGTFLAMIVLGERLSGLGAAGAALLLISVMDSGRPRTARQRRSPSPPPCSRWCSR
jgi:DME family drug/metabolite transporter